MHGRWMVRWRKRGWKEKEISENNTVGPKSAGLSVSQSIRENMDERKRKKKKEGRKKPGASRTWS
jgi:hypothetical protein